MVKKYAAGHLSRSSPKTDPPVRPVNSQRRASIQVVATPMGLSTLWVETHCLMLDLMHALRVFPVDRQRRASIQVLEYFTSVSPMHCLLLDLMSFKVASTARPSWQPMSKHPRFSDLSGKVQCKAESRW